MLADLKFVQGAVARKNIVPEMTHFLIEDGRITAFNGTLALSSPIDMSINCSPKAETLIKAIQQCDETVALSMTPAGRLRVQSGKMRVLVDCIDRTIPPVGPEGEFVQVNGEALVKAFKTIEPFIGEDASRPWATGVLLRDGCAYATCNVVIVQYWIGEQLPHVVNVPYSAIKEVIRIGEPPIGMRVTDKSASFMYASERWIRTNLLSTEWPNVDPILERPCNLQPIDEGIFDSVSKVKNFMDKTGRIVFRNGVVSTHDDQEEGGHCDIPMNLEGVYAYDMFMGLKGVATHADFSTWPNPCMFQGNQLRGAIIGRKL